MARSSEAERGWSDAQLIEAVAASRSWRGVMRTYTSYIVGRASGIMTRRAAAS